MSAVITKKVYPIIMNAGIMRDTTILYKNNWSDGQWCRFYQGKPIKMGGYKQIISSLDTVYTGSIPRGLYVLPKSPNFNIYIGNASTVGYVPIDFFGNPVGSFVDRTPALPTAPAFTANDNNQWQFDVMYSGVSNIAVLIAFAAPNGTAIDSAIQRSIYYGPAYDNSRLIRTGFNVSGGIVVLHPYLLMLDNDGIVIISEASNPTVELDRFSIAPYKLIAGLPVRGGNTSPAGLIWSLDRLIRVTMVGSVADPQWNFDTISAQISVMSGNSMIEYDSVYYWWGVDRWFQYNGVVSELKNDMNRNYVLNRLNYAQRQKVWATKDNEWGEIWWHYPSGDNTECDSAVIYNLREDKWYDTSISRSCGYYSSVFAQPIWAANTQIAGDYPIWVHDEGVDQNINSTLTAIDSYIETSEMSWMDTGPDQQKRGMDKWISYYRIEPDFVQTGEMTAEIRFRDYAQSATTYSSGPYTFGPTTPKIDPDRPRQGRQSTIRFRSNVIGGNYQMGECVVVATIGDGRQSVPGE